MLRVINHGGDLLAVPPMHPKTPRVARVKVYELVLRRQFGLAATVADIERELILFRERQNENLAVLIAATPHATPRRAAA